MNIFWLAQTDGSVGNRLFGSADSFLENRTEGSAKPIIRSDTILYDLQWYQIMKVPLKPESTSIKDYIDAGYAVAIGNDQL